MNAAVLIVGFGVGLLLGVVYFGGLWLTLRKLRDSERPSAALAIGSFLARTAIAVGVLILVVRDGRWERLLACVVGMMVARAVLVRVVARETPKETPGEHQS